MDAYVRKYRWDGKNPNSCCPCSIRDEKTIEEVEASVRQNPSLSIRKRIKALNIKKSSKKISFNSRTWFQQDATCHTSNAAMGVVHELFPNKVISRRCNINWPSRSPDLSPFDYFVWGYLKSKVYENKPTNLEQLKQTMRSEMAAISRVMCQRFISNLRV
ncbi:hypothetical protein WA026_002822 [Henosepilachna vigintioctopunctata]|uniref:Uncharacterized protein n=1 Tax=Henosepilachna vigintioctopunctata TaxID=420089 RepID=A0AAW1U1B1_9CUCU